MGLEHTIQNYRSTLNSHFRLKLRRTNNGEQVVSTVNFIPNISAGDKPNGAQISNIQIQNPKQKDQGKLN